MCLWGPGGALVDVGEAMKRLAEVKDSLDIDVKQNFIDPLQGLCDKDLREIQVSDTPDMLLYDREINCKSLYDSVNDYVDDCDSYLLSTT